MNRELCEGDNYVLFPLIASVPTMAPLKKRLLPKRMDDGTRACMGRRKKQLKCGPYSISSLIFAHREPSTMSANEKETKISRGTIAAGDVTGRERHGPNKPREEDKGRLSQTSQFQTDIPAQEGEGCF